MSFTKKGTDYESYSYLERGRDYKLFNLADETRRVDLYLVPLSDGEEKRVEQIVTDNLMVSLHDYITVFPENMSEASSYTHEGRMTTANKALGASYWDVVFDNLMDGLINIASKNPPHEKVEYVKGVENPTESSYNVVRWLVKHGYSDEDIVKAVGGNAVRLLSEVWA